MSDTKHVHYCEGGNMTCAVRGYCQCECGMVNLSTNDVRLDWEDRRPMLDALSMPIGAKEIRILKQLRKDAAHRQLGR